jgi:CubicO group peptidase (beta-lactamase class C family)
MRDRLLFYALLFVSHVPSCGALQADNVESFLRTQMSKRHIVGLQVAVVQHGKVVLHRACGIASIQDSAPATDHTIFPINSITKAFTGVAIMQLVEAGRLDLGAPVSRYLDGLPVPWQGVTIRQLLTHESGLPNIMEGNEKMVQEGDEDSAWAKVQTLPLEFEPGARFSYNQTNYVLLGRIIDRLGGEPFAQFIDEHQFRVVGMPHTVFGDSRDVVAHSARDYTYFRKTSGATRRGDTLRNVFEEFPPFLRTAAGLNSTAEDLARWIIALQSGKLLKAKSSLATLWTAGVLNDGTNGGFSKLLNGYALGWETANRPEHRALTAIGGGRSALFVYPEDDLAIVILTNLQGSSPESFIDEVASYWIPDMSPSAGFGLPAAIKAMQAVLRTRGFEHAAEVIREEKAKDSAFRLPEGDVNAWGYRLVEDGHIRDAIEIFKLNAEMYPSSGNTYDSLAAAYESAGDKTLAIQNYRRSLDLDPKNAHAVERLKALDH